MGLWIRTQDKKALVKVDEVYLQSQPTNDIYGVCYDKWCLGIYATEKRALEIIDEIQSSLFDLMVFKNLEIGATPKEREQNLENIRLHNFVAIDTKCANENQFPKVELQPKSATVYEMPKD